MGRSIGRIVAVTVVAAAVVAMPEVASADMGPGPVNLLGSDIDPMWLAMAALAVLIVALSVFSWVRLSRIARQTRREREVISEGEQSSRGSGDGGE